MKEFTSMAGFAVELMTLRAGMAVAAHHGLERASQLIEKTAKDQFGQLQPEVGPYAAWAELADSTKEEKERLGYAKNADFNPLVREGDLRESITHEVAALEAVIGSDSDVAVYQELGTSTIPPRAFLGPAAIQTEKRVALILGAVVGRFLEGKQLVDYGAAGAFLKLPK